MVWIVWSDTFLKNFVHKFAGVLDYILEVPLVSALRCKIQSSSCLHTLSRGPGIFSSLVRPQNWPGRRRRRKGGRIGALVVQRWYKRCSDIAMVAIVGAKFWACSKQLHKSRRRGWLRQKQDFLGLGNHWASSSIFWSPDDGTVAAALC